MKMPADNPVKTCQVVCLPATTPSGPRARSRAALAAAITTAAALLAACAHSYGPGALAPGQSEQAAIERLGPPTARYPGTDGGVRLEFARGPYGIHTFMVDVDAGRQITQVRQVLTEQVFATLKPGMTGDEVRYAIGTPSDTMRIGRQNLDVWSYRYDNPFCVWYQVSVDLTSQRVRELGNGPDPRCERNDRDMFGRAR